MLEDIRYGIRTLSKSPGFTLLAVLILAVGVGTNTAVFSLVNASVLRPVSGIEDSEGLVVVGERHDGTPFPISYPDYLDLSQRATAFDGLLSTRDATFSINVEGEPERVRGSLVSGNYFSVLGIDPLVGRTILSEDDRGPGEHPVAVLGYGFWQSRFGADPRVPGRTLKLNGRIFTIVGVAPEGFGGLDSGKRRDVWVPRSMEAQLSSEGKEALTGRELASVTVVGRLKEGTGIDRAQAEMSALADQLASAYKRRTPLGDFEVRELNRLRSGGEDLLAALAVMIVVSLILVIACANVANLLLARAGARKREIAVRLAMGAGRARLVRQLVTESLLLSLAGGGAGLLLSLWATDLIWMLISMGAPGEDLLRLDIGIDLRVLGYTLGLSFMTGLMFGLAPALQATKVDLISALKEGDHSAGYRRSRLRSGLAISQISVSLVLLILSALFVMATLNQLAGKSIPDDRNILLLSVAPGDQGYTEARGTRFYSSLLENVRDVPGVESAGVADSVQISGTSGDVRVQVEGNDRPGGKSPTRVSAQTVSAGYFTAMGFPVVQGREFNDDDRSGAPGVVMVNETMARTSWPGESPSGKRLRTQNYEGKNGAFLQVVGVVRDANDRFSGKAVPSIYLPVSQNYLPEMMLVVKGGADGQALLAAVKREVRALDPDLPVFNAGTLSEHSRQLLATERQISTFVTLAGLIALALASIGIYGVISYSVSQRTHEIGVRMAVGARPADVFQMVLGEGLRLALIGIAIGIVISALVTRVIASELYGVSALDPRIYGGIALLLICVSAVASYLPARRATRVDPMVALRYE
ncbi:MAG TPA: ABC transporter permease [Blastocatellia bacterium]|jgi:predicted permease|nr:ABC transporter permease [Blastocatellia bacterium]